MKTVKIIPLVLAVTILLSACSLVNVVEDVFFPKPSKPAQVLEDAPTRAPNTDAQTVTDDFGREWKVDNGNIKLNEEPVRRLTARIDSPISYIEGCLYYMAPEGFTRYDIEEEKTYPLYYDVMDVAVAGLNRIYYVRDNMLFSFFASETEIDAVFEGFLSDDYDVNIVDNILYIQGYSIDLLTDSVQQ